MEIWQAIILGAVQGLAEFLPISSSGHLLLIQRWLGIEGGQMFFDVMLHIGTLIPVFIVFYKEIFGLFKSPFKKLLLLILASIPAAVTGMVLGDVIDGAFYGGGDAAAYLLSAMFLITAAELIISETVSKKNKETLPLGVKNAAIMGAAQGIAIVPGLSRSGTVISAGCYCRLEREETANFAFLMSIPVILGAALVSGYKCVKNGINFEVLPILFGVVTAAVTGYLAVKLMLKIIKKANYKWFALYLVLMSAASIISMSAFGV